MQIWRGSSGKWAAFVCVFVSHRAAAACDLHEEPEAHTYARAKACEAMLLDGELARFRAHAPSGVDIDAYVRRALAKHRFRLPHRDRFPELLGKLGLNRTAVEIGVREGHWSRMFLGRWRGRAYHGVDPLLLSADLERYRTLMPEVHAYGVETIAALENDPRWHFHHGLDHKFVDAFSDGSLDFVYIDSAHNYRDVTDTLTDGGRSCGRGASSRATIIVWAGPREEKRGSASGRDRTSPRSSRPPASRPAACTRASSASFATPRTKNAGAKKRLASAGWRSPPARRSLGADLGSSSQARAASSAIQVGGP